MLEKLNINEWAEEDRPREKLAAKGAGTLSDAELLAILIGSGNTRETAVDLMRRILLDCGGSLKRLGRKSILELTQEYNGIGEAKAITILAACELGRRRQREETDSDAQILTSEDIYKYFLPLMQDLDVEESHVMALNRSNQIIDTMMASRGGMTGTVVDVRPILRFALERKATSIVLAHNHPTGSPRPSKEDNILTRRLAEAARTLDIHLMDHVIVSDGRYYSYLDEGKL